VTGGARYAERGRRNDVYGTRRPHPRSLAALRLLAICPCVPIDVFVCLAGGQPVSAYQLLGRLRRAGLADVQRQNLGHLVDKRPVSVWSITERGRAALSCAAAATDDLPGESLLPCGTRQGKPHRVRAADLPLLVAAYRLLAALVAEDAAAGHVVQVRAWEFRWRRCCRSSDAAPDLIVELPAAAVLAPLDRAAKHSMHEPLLLLPDLGTAPVVRHREAIRRLVTVSARRHASEADVACATAAQPVLVIATPNPDGRGTRAAAWSTLLRRVAERQGEPPVPARILGWDEVAGIASRPRWCHGRPAQQSSRGCERMLDLVGRHPFLTPDQLADLLGTTRIRAARLRGSLVERGWLRLVPTSEIPPTTLEILGADAMTQSLVEITSLGRRTLAGWLGLAGSTATRHHGLIGHGRGQAGQRRRLLSALAHTLGANAVFVALVLAARTATAGGGDETLEEWRSAAACERRRCKPDGYGRYRRGASSHGFLLEYDRGTERAWKYLAKFRAYYAYRDSGEAARDYDGFPTLLFVTTSAAAEQRIAEAAQQVWYRRGGDSLPILLTTTDLIAGQHEGILGRIWRTPAPIAVSQRAYWLPGGPPRGLFGAGRGCVRTPRLVWPSTGRIARSRARLAQVQTRPATSKTVARVSAGAGARAVY